MGFLVRFAENSSIGGLPELADSKNWIGRIYWIIVVASSWVLAAYLTNEAFIDWANNPILTTMETDRISDVQFPKIVVCPPRVDILLASNNFRESSSRKSFFLQRFVVQSARFTGYGVS